MKFTDFDQFESFSSGRQLSKYILFDFKFSDVENFTISFTENAPTDTFMVFKQADQSLSRTIRWLSKPAWVFLVAIIDVIFVQATTFGFTNLSITKGTISTFACVITWFICALWKFWNWIFQIYESWPMSHGFQEQFLGIFVAVINVEFAFVDVVTSSYGIPFAFEFSPFCISYATIRSLSGFIPDIFQRSLWSVIHGERSQMWKTLGTRFLYICDRIHHWHRDKDQNICKKNFQFDLYKFRSHRNCEFLSRNHPHPDIPILSFGCL